MHGVLHNQHQPPLAGLAHESRVERRKLRPKLVVVVVVVHPDPATAEPARDCGTSINKGVPV